MRREIIFCLLLGLLLLLLILTGCVRNVDQWEYKDWYNVYFDCYTYRIQCPDCYSAFEIVVKKDVNPDPHIVQCKSCGYDIWLKEALGG